MFHHSFYSSYRLFQIDPRLHHRKSYAALENEYDDDDDGDEDDDDDDEDDDYDSDSRYNDEEEMANEEEDEAIYGRKRENLRLVHHLRARAALAAKLVRRRFNVEKLRQYNLDLNTRALTSKLSNYRNDLNQELLWKLEMLSNHHYNQPGRDIEPLAPNLNNIPIQGHAQEISGGMTLGDVMNGQNTPHNAEMAQRLRENFQSTELMRQSEFNNPVQAEPMESAEPQVQATETLNQQASQSNLQSPPVVEDPVAVADKATYSFAPLAGDISKAATKATAQHLYDKFAAMDDNLIKLANAPGANFMASTVGTSRSFKKQNNANSKKKSRMHTIRKKKTKISRRKRKRKNLLARKRSEKMDLKSVLEKITPSTVISKHNKITRDSSNNTDVDALIEVQHALKPISDISVISGKDAVSIKRTLWKLNHIIEMLMNSTKREETASVLPTHIGNITSKNFPGNISNEYNVTTTSNFTSPQMKSTSRSEFTKPSGNNTMHSDAQSVHLNKDIMKKYIKYKKYLRQLRKETQSRKMISSNDNSFENMDDDDDDSTLLKMEEKFINDKTKTNRERDAMKKTELTLNNPQPALEQNNLQILIPIINKKTNDVDNKTRKSPEVESNERFLQKQQQDSIDNFEVSKTKKLPKAERNERTLQQKQPSTTDNLNTNSDNPFTNNTNPNQSVQQNNTDLTSLSTPLLQLQPIKKNMTVKDKNNTTLQNNLTRHRQNQILKILSTKAKEQSRSIVKLNRRQ